MSAAYIAPVGRSDTSVVACMVVSSRLNSVPSFSHEFSIDPRFIYCFRSFILIWNCTRGNHIFLFQRSLHHRAQGEAVLPTQGRLLDTGACEVAYKPREEVYLLPVCCGHGPR